MIMLDALLDTRIATLYSMDRDKAFEYLFSGYLDRDTDDFPGFDSKVFKEKYDGRTEEILKDSVVAAVWRRLRDFVAQTIQAAESSPFVKTPVVVVNTYPYHLSESKQNAIKYVLEGMIVSGLKVVFERLSYKEMSPKYLKRTFVEVILYDYWNWMSAVSEDNAFEEDTCPEVRMIGPAIFLPDAVKKTGMSPDLLAESVEGFFRPFIKLDLIPASFFSPDLNRLADMERDKRSKK